ncbi:DUF4357 domain-containing protein [Actinomadura harenae]|uniref:DUF4357 domain-containing protein n=1 Tax=Actinomadura harenae TaxID=2483351 RepID=A0A3M2M4H7_9ACTN|nr:DUF4357 domain-containing protein [Actinomadura harenae]RMI44499.1 DUF4357 domain-containing protein [Actinomadura harenae]
MDKAEVSGREYALLPIFSVTSKGATARAIALPGRAMLVLKGSRAVAHNAEGFGKGKPYYGLRAGLISKKHLAEDGDPDSLIATRDLLFGSPTAALTVMFGGGGSGPAHWKTSDGRTYKEVIGD